MNQLDILVEEVSIAEVIKVILPKVLPDGWQVNENVFIRVHEGKQDLKDSIPRKLKAAQHGNSKRGFVIVQDQDANDCRALKSQLVSCCDSALEGVRKDIPYKVRIVCHELEAWYLGDMPAIAKVFPKFKVEKQENRAIFRNPDKCICPKNELKKVVGDYGQIIMAKSMAPLMDPHENRSTSFHSFFDGVLKVIREL